MVSKKSARSKSRHRGSDARRLSKAERDFHLAIHSAEQATKRQVAWSKVAYVTVVTAGTVLTAYVSEVQGPGGAPWWCWVVMSVSTTCAVGFALLLWKETCRNGSLIERFAPYVKNAERAEDSHRSSSQLTSRGETNNGDNS